MSREETCRRGYNCLCFRSVKAAFFLVLPLSLRNKCTDTERERGQIFPSYKAKEIGGLLRRLETSASSPRLDKRGRENNIHPIPGNRAGRKGRSRDRERLRHVTTATRAKQKHGAREVVVREKKKRASLGLSFCSKCDVWGRPRPTAVYYVASLSAVGGAASLTPRPPSSAAAHAEDEAKDIERVKCCFE